VPTRPRGSPTCSEDFHKVLALTDLAVRPPEVPLLTVYGTQGMDFIEPLRG